MATTDGANLKDLKDIIAYYEKRRRNLEKRKNRIEEIKEKKELNDDQQRAVSRYEVVINSQEMIDEFICKLSCVLQEVEKQAKKSAKREQIERTKREFEQAHACLQVRRIISLAPRQEETPCEAFSYVTAELGLTEEEVSHLTTLREAVITNSGRLSEVSRGAAEHLLKLVDASERPSPVQGVSYCQLSDLIRRISALPLFDSPQPEAFIVEWKLSREAPVPEEVPVIEEEESPVETAEVASCHEEDVEEIVPVIEEAPSPAPCVSPTPPEPTVQEIEEVPEKEEEVVVVVEEEPPAEMTFLDLIRPLQGGFNFLQKSIVIEHEVPPMSNGSHVPAKSQPAAVKLNGHTEPEAPIEWAKMDEEFGSTWNEEETQEARSSEVEDVFSSATQSAYLHPEREREIRGMAGREIRGGRPRGGGGSWGYRDGNRSTTYQRFNGNRNGSGPRGPDNWDSGKRNNAMNGGGSYRGGGGARRGGRGGFRSAGAAGASHNGHDRAE